MVDRPAATERHRNNALRVDDRMHTRRAKWTRLMAFVAYCRGTHALRRAMRGVSGVVAVLLITASACNFAPAHAQVSGADREARAIEALLIDQERAFWQAVSQHDSTAAYRLYLQKFADNPGTYSAIARQRIDGLLGTASSPTHTLTVRSNLYDDLVTINGVDVGPTGPRAHEYPPGVYHVVVRKPAHQSWEKVVILERDTVLRAQLAPQLMGEPVPNDDVALAPSGRPSTIESANTLPGTALEPPVRAGDDVDQSSVNTASAPVPIDDPPASCEGDFTGRFSHGDIERHACKVKILGESGQMQFEEQFGDYRSENEIVLLKHRTMTEPRWYWSWAPVDEYLRGGFDHLDQVGFSKPYPVKFGDRRAYFVVDFAYDEYWQNCAGFVSANVGQVSANRMVLGIFCRVENAYSKDELTAMLEKVEF